MPGKKYKHSVSHVVPDLVPHRLRSDRTSHRQRPDLARPINSRALPRRHRPRSDARPISCARTPRRHRPHTDARPVDCARSTSPSAAHGRTSHQLARTPTTPSAAHGRASCRLCTLHVAIGRTRTRVPSTRAHSTTPSAAHGRASCRLCTLHVAIGRARTRTDARLVDSARSTSHRPHALDIPSDWANCMFQQASFFDPLPMIE